MTNCRFWLFCFFSLFSWQGISLAVDREYFIDDQSCSDEGPGSEIEPWCTFNHAFSDSGMGAGDILVIKDGEYLNNVIVDPPSGTAQHYTVIKAENDGGSVINDSHASTAGYPGNVLSVGTNYIRIEGLKIINGGGHVAAISGNYVELKRNAFANANPTGSVVALTGANILLEDSWVWGAGCSMVFVGGSIHGCTAGLGENIVLRRVVVRSDYARGSDCNGVLMYGADNIVLENVIALDFNAAADISTVHYRNGFRSRDGYCATNHVYRGCIALNLPEDIGAMGYQGFELTNVGQATHSVAWHIGGDAFAMRNWDENQGLNHVTGGRASRGILMRNQRLSNSLMINTQSNDIAGSCTHNHFYESPSGGQNVTAGDPGLKHLVRIEENSPCYGTGNDGGNRGATILSRIVNGTTTLVSLWPWPYESRIKQDFSTSFTNIPEQYKNSKRGFCEEVSDLYGGPRTLTSYIWEYLSKPCPAEICTANDSTRPSAPDRLRVRQD